MNASGPQADSQRKFAEEMLTQAVLLAAKCEDDELFEASVAQLKVLYTDYPNVCNQEQKCSVLGLNLLRLLAMDQLATFHSELELLSEEEAGSTPVVFAVALARSLAEGSYHHVVSAKPPSDPFAAFMPKLLEAVRVDIANCSEVAYKSLAVNDAKSLMFFQSVEELEAFVQESRPLWEMRDGRLWFTAAEGGKVQIPSMKLVAQTLSYANELERIV